MLAKSARLAEGVSC